jgi:hypothetical protein
MIAVDGLVAAHVQVRGSVPVFWKSSGVLAASELTLDGDELRRGFEAHFRRLSEIYG